MTFMLRITEILTSTKSAELVANVQALNETVKICVSVCISWTEDLQEGVIHLRQQPHLAPIKSFDVAF